MTREHIGLIFNLIGTLCFAFAFKTEDEPAPGKREMERLNPFLKFWYSSHVILDKKLFWSGVAVKKPLTKHYNVVTL